MKYRIAAVSFLNTLPLVDRLLRGEDPQVALTRALPSRLAAELAADHADVALLPVVEVLRGAAPGILPGCAIACQGNADSVKLFIHGDPARISRLRTDRGSRTSVALARVVLAERHGVRPELVEIEPVPGELPPAGEAALVIGDRCFAYEGPFREGLGTEGTVIDLGGAWFELNGLPFVFAAWAPGAAFLARAGADDLQRLTDLLVDALEDGWSRRHEIAAREAAAGCLGPGGEATAAAIAYYFEHSLQYRLEDEHLDGVEAFRRLCIRHDILSADTPPLALVR